MRSVANNPIQRQTSMSTSTPQERIRASIALTRAQALAEWLLQCDKANPSFTLRDLRDDDERAIWVDAATAILLDQDLRTERMIRINQLRGYVHAHEEKEQADVDWQARQDVIKFAGRSYYGTPGRCFVCREPVLTNKVAVHIGRGLYSDAHGLCCAKNEGSYEFISEFLYRVIEVSHDDARR